MIHSGASPSRVTERNGEQLEFHGLGRRAVVGRLDGGTIRSDGGARLLAEVETKTRIIERFAKQFIDQRNPQLIEHRVREWVGQRVLAWRSATRTSTTMTTDVSTPCSQPPWANSIPRAARACAGRIRARRWPVRAP
ncbi:MAG: hypothetical protein EOM91_16290 [Sphingobacteriia bacterium]|nr:hypothetical protein [Sphingobacteriia bacterium]